jgi:hypothetical protein
MAISDLLLNCHIENFKKKSNCTDGEKYNQLAWTPNFNQFQHIMTKIKTHLDTKTSKLD